MRPDCDPLFPPGVGRPPGGEWFSDVTVPVLGGVGHFAPVEAPAAFAAAILDATRR